MCGRCGRTKDNPQFRGLFTQGPKEDGVENFTKEQIGGGMPEADCDCHEVPPQAWKRHDL